MPDGNTIDVEPVRSFIRREFLFDRSAALADDQPLFPSVVDSLGVMELVEFLEETYGVELGGDDLMAENFGTLTSIVELLRRKMA